VRHRAQRLQQREAVAGLFGRGQHAVGDDVESAEVTGDPVQVPDLIGGQQPGGDVTGGAEELLGFGGESDGGLGVPLAPADEDGEGELRRPAGARGRRRSQERLDPAHRLQADLGLGVRPVLDDPFHGARHRLVDLEPAGVPGGQKLEQRLQQGQRLPVQLPGLGLGEGLPESVDGLGVTGIG
jgi:hypothetical protein